MGATITRTLIALLFVLALIFLLVYLLKRFSPRWLNLAQKGEGSEEEIMILAVRALAPKRSLYLLKIGKHQVLIGASEQGLERLGHWELEDYPAEEKTRVSSNSGE